MRNPFRRAPLQRTPAAFDAADQDLLEALEELEQAKNYSAWILHMIGPHIRGRILEVGAGRGTYSTYFADESAFPKGTVTFDCALIMRNIAHEWHAGAPMYI